PNCGASEQRRDATATCRHRIGLLHSRILYPLRLRVSLLLYLLTPFSPPSVCLCASVAKRFEDQKSDPFPLNLTPSPQYFCCRLLATRYFSPEAFRPTLTAPGPKTVFITDRFVTVEVTLTPIMPTPLPAYLKASLKVI